MTQEKALIYDDSFKQELTETIKYISFDIQNPDAAVRLLKAVQAAIEKRFRFPGTFEPYRPSKQLKFTYYRIYVNNYTVFYYFQEDVMHISHFLFSGSDVASKL